MFLHLTKLLEETENEKQKALWNGMKTSNFENSLPRVSIIYEAEEIDDSAREQLYEVFEFLKKYTHLQKKMGEKTLAFEIKMREIKG